MSIFIVTHIWSKYIISRNIIIKKGNIYAYKYMHGKFLITSIKKGGGGDGTKSDCLLQF